MTFAGTMLPKTQEISQLKMFRGDKTKLSSAEKFFLKIMVNPFSYQLP